MGKKHRRANRSDSSSDESVKKEKSKKSKRKHESYDSSDSDRKKSRKDHHSRNTNRKSHKGRSRSRSKDRRQRRKDTPENYSPDNRKYSRQKSRNRSVSPRKVETNESILERLNAKNKIEDKPNDKWDHRKFNSHEQSNGNHYGSERHRPPRHMDQREDMLDQRRKMRHDISKQLVLDPGRECWTICEEQGKDDSDEFSEDENPKNTEKVLRDMNDKEKMKRHEKKLRKRLKKKLKEKMKKKMEKKRSKKSKKKSKKRKHESDDSDSDIEVTKEYLEAKKSKKETESESSSSSDSSSESSEEEEDSMTWIERTKGPEGIVDEEVIGPMPKQQISLSKKELGKALLPGEGAAMAAFVAEGRRIPRRGEIGLTSDEISFFEAQGYVMSGSRHRRMEAVRLRKENQIYSADEKRALAVFSREERSKKEASTMAYFRDLVAKKQRY